MAWKKLIFSDDATAVSVSKNSGAVIGTRPELNFVEGTNIGLSIADDAVNEEIDITISSVINSDLDMNSNKITELANPALSTDGANKAYVDITNSTVNNLSACCNFSYLRVDGSNVMTGTLVTNQNHIDLGPAGILYTEDVNATGNKSGLTLKAGTDYPTYLVMYGKDHALQGRTNFYTYNGDADSVNPLYIEGSTGAPRIGVRYGLLNSSINEFGDGLGVTIDELHIKDGGFLLGSDADGDIYYRSSGALERLGKGTARQLLSMNNAATAPEWVRPTNYIYLEAFNGTGYALIQACQGPVYWSSATYKNVYCTLDFDNTADEWAMWNIIMPANWDCSNITISIFWTCAGGDTGQTVRWSMSSRGYINGSTLDIVPAGGNGVTDTWIGENYLHITEPFGFTPTTTIAGGFVNYYVYRDISEDDLNCDARLLKLQILYNVS